MYDTTDSTNVTEALQLLHEAAKHNAEARRKIAEAMRLLQAVISYQQIDI